MRLFTLLAVLLLVGGSALLVDSGLRIRGCVVRGVFSPHVWTTEFWLLVPDTPSAGLGPNGQWLVRLVGGVLAGLFGLVLLRFSQR